MNDLVGLGLGTNVGKRLTQLRLAYQKLDALSGTSIVTHSSLYLSEALLPENAPSDWNKNYFNMVVILRTERRPYDLLKALQQIETAMGRPSDHAFWGPRVIDIDVLMWGRVVQNDAELTIPHSELLNRNFALQPLLECLPDWRHPSWPDLDLQYYLKTMPVLTTLPYRIHEPTLMGIVNVTPDSFSEHKQGIAHYKTIRRQCVDMVNAGAEWLDIGAESTNPKAESLTHAEEWARLKPIMDTLNDLIDDKAMYITPSVSVDSYHAETAKKLIAYPVAMLNDVYGNMRQDIAKIWAQTNRYYVFMHNTGPAGNHHLKGDSQKVLEQIITESWQKKTELISAGFDEKQLIFDPGFGFGKLANHVKAMIQNANRFKQLNLPVLIGHSRKGFAMPPVRHLPAASRDLESAFLSQYFAYKDAADILRVHNIDATARMIKMAQYVKSNKID